LKKFVGANINFLFSLEWVKCFVMKIFKGRFAKIILKLTFAPAFKKAR